MFLDTDPVTADCIQYLSPPAICPSSVVDCFQKDVEGVQVRKLKSDRKRRRGQVGRRQQSRYQILKMPSISVLSSKHETVRIAHIQPPDDANIDLSAYQLHRHADFDYDFHPVNA